MADLIWVNAVLAYSLEILIVMVTQELDVGTNTTLLRILLKQDTALLSHVSQSVSVCVTGVTSQVFSII